MQQPIDDAFAHRASPLDAALTAAQRALETLAGAHRSQRAMPLPDVAQPTPAMTPEQCREAAALMRVNHVGKRIVSVTVPGVVGTSFRARLNTAPFGARGKVSWREWLSGQDTMAVAHVYAEADAHAGSHGSAAEPVMQNPADMRRAS